MKTANPIETRHDGRLPRRRPHYDTSSAVSKGEDAAASFCADDSAEGSYLAAGAALTLGPRRELHLELVALQRAVWGADLRRHNREL